MRPEPWHLDLVLGLFGAAAVVAGLTLAGPSAGGLFTAAVGALACLILLPIAAMQIARVRKG